MKKALIVSTVSRQFTLFERGNIEVLKELGYEIHGAANYEDATPALEELGIKQHHIDIQRSPFKVDNFKAYKQLLKLMKKEEFDLVHCHAPMGGVVGRLAAKSVGIKNVLYTAHGFHFFKGAPRINWMVYYPIEKICSYFTKILITINQEDYMLATKKMKAEKTKYVRGIGLNVNRFNDKSININEKKASLGIPIESTILLSVGELNKNKNHQIIIKALSELDKINIHYCIIGRGENKKYLEDLAVELNIKDKIHFLGYRDDVNELYEIGDIFCFPSYREGLSVALMEAMVMGLPVIASNVRGNVDLILNNKGGLLYSPNDKNGFKQGIEKLINEDKLRKEMGDYNKNNVSQYTITEIKMQMKEIYKEVIKDEKGSAFIIK